jgi:multicomponent Na+:H+ antiporter subunit F
MFWIDVGFFVLGLAFLTTVWRMAVGPTNADRAVAADLAFFVLIGVLALAAVRFDQPVFFDLVLVATLVGFVASLALARLIDRRAP